MNHPFLALPFAFGFADEGIIIPLASLVIPIVIVPTALYFKYQRQRLWHETARIALEKGQPLPVNSAKDEQESHSPRARNDLRTGMILIAVSVGLMLTPWRFNGLEQVNGLWFGAAIPGCIGVALLLNALLTAVVSHFTKKNRSDNSAPNAPFKKS